MWGRGITASLGLGNLAQLSLRSQDETKTFPNKQKPRELPGKEPRPPGEGAETQKAPENVGVRTGTDCETATTMMMVKEPDPGR